ncbi:hypothetical protein [Furfurilactobacillus siliginis]|uniref:Uncharacterized protein n=1 Tax=Furfurilactobacillus siliginis TaxID=348151 RepID=A0A0R2L3Y7_9LACO|nr:hypothetical protein [Furfurilactobacillus siliginis]KRN93581.1 hypothetical protein IV55_GL001000 [Furfurilactobacillus siliginis]GEK29237.1 hypothetical protein LSI01_15480 [Furfurilactobacillus siliginis]
MSQKYNRAGFVLLDAVVGLLLTTSGCWVVSQAQLVMSNRLVIERRRVDQARVAYEKSCVDLGQAMAATHGQ